MPTPGPWFIDERGKGLWFVCANRPDGTSPRLTLTLMNDLEADSVPVVESVANGRLIAAAPELLAACKALVDGEDDVPVMDLARAAIAKAEGRELDPPKLLAQLKASIEAQKAQKS